MTHDINEALFLGNRVMVMNKGKIEQFDTSEKIVANPASDYVAQLLGNVRQNKALWEQFK